MDNAERFARRHEHSGGMHMDMTMGGSSSGGLPKLRAFPTFYWAVVGTAIGIATLVNVANYVIYRQRYANYT
jgi:hypothetical protein